MFDEDDLLPISGLQHLLYCERRAGLVLLEQAWEENRFTAAGRARHQIAHTGPPVESRGDLRVARGLRLCSRRLGLAGIADVVEFHRVQADRADADAGVALPGLEGRWQPFPVEYKSGRLRPERGYEVQLCAQALCLEEMLGTVVPSGALYYGATGRRLHVPFAPELRAETEAAASRLRQIVRSGLNPVAVRDARCRKCSLVDACLPKVVDGRRRAARYLADILDQARKELL